MLKSGGNFVSVKTSRSPIKMVKSLTRQSEVKDADINEIVRRFVRTGQLPVIERPPLVGDFTNVGSFSDAMELVLRAERSFDMLPADVRKRFDNSPQAFLAFMEKAEEKDLKELGFLVKKEVSDGNSGGNVVDGAGGAS